VYFICADNKLTAVDRRNVITDVFNFQNILTFSPVQYYCLSRHEMLHVLHLCSKLSLTDVVTDKPMMLILGLHHVFSLDHILCFLLSITSLLFTWITLKLSLFPSILSSLYCCCRMCCHLLLLYNLVSSHSINIYRCWKPCLMVKISAERCWILELDSVSFVSCYCFQFLFNGHFSTVALTYCGNRIHKRSYHHHHHWWLVNGVCCNRRCCSCHTYC